MTSYPTVSCGPCRVNGRENDSMWRSWGIGRGRNCGAQWPSEGMPYWDRRLWANGMAWKGYHCSFLRGWQRDQREEHTLRKTTWHTETMSAEPQQPIKVPSTKIRAAAPHRQVRVQLTPYFQDSPPHPTPLAGKEWRNKIYLLQTTDSEGHDLAREGREKRWEWVSNWTRQNFLIMRNDSKAVGSSQDVTEGQEREVVIGGEWESFKSCTSLNIENSLYLIQS